MALTPPFQQGEIIELTPGHIGKRGEAVGEYREWRVRVAGGIPGEAARIRIVHVSKGGRVASGKWLAPADRPHPARRDPRCAIHERCGGCGLQQLGTDAALRLKIERARSVVGRDAHWLDPIASPRPFGYRCKTFLIPQRRGRRLILGARPPRGERLVDTRGCDVLRPELEALCDRLREAVAGRPELEATLRTAMLRCNRAGETQLTLVHRGPGETLERYLLAAGPGAGFLQRHDRPGNRVHSDERERQVIGKGPIVERFGERLDVAVPPTAFVQGNPDVADALYRAAAAELAGERIAELYCGAGAAGLLSLADRPAAFLHGIDKAPRAIATARDNAERNGLADRCRFEAVAAEEASGDWDAVLVNPPRAGCHESVLESIGASRAERLVYLSCNPATLARDAVRLGWSLVSILAADLLPQTAHLELLAVLERRRG